MHVVGITLTKHTRTTTHSDRGKLFTIVMCPYPYDFDARWFGDAWILNGVFDDVVDDVIDDAIVHPMTRLTLKPPYAVHFL